MHAASMTFGRPVRLGAIRPSSLFVGATAGLLATLHRVDQWLLSQRESGPKSRAEVLEWANRLEPSDPGFAADLRGAALRDDD